MTQTISPDVPRSRLELVMAIATENPGATVKLTTSAIVIDIGLLDHLRLPPGEWDPSDTLEVTHIGNGLAQFLQISAQTPQLRHLILSDCSIAYIALTGFTSLWSLTVRGDCTPIALELPDSVSIERLHLEYVQVNARGDLSRLRSLHLGDSHLVWPGRINAEVIEISGRAGVGVTGVSAQRLQVFGASSRMESERGETRFQTIHLPENTSLELRGDVFHVERLTNRVALRLAGGTRLVLTQTEPISDLNLAGTGSVHVVGTLIRPTFDPEGQLRIVLDQNARLLGGSGVICLDARARSTCSGSIDRSRLGLSRLIQARDAVLENVSIFELEEPGDSANIPGCRRFLPWLPSGPRAAAAQRHQVRRRALQLEDSHLAWRENVDMWKSAQQAALTKGVPAGTQSAMRVAIYRARRRSLPWRSCARERLLLSLYAFIGYGERITLPLFWWLGLAAGAAAFLTNVDPGPSRTGFLDEMIRLDSTPFAFFRLSSPATSFPGVTGTVISVVIELLGVSMIGVAIIAARRQLRPDDKPTN